MRQIDPVTNLVLAVLAGFGLLATLSLPWFAAPQDSPVDTDGPVERGAWVVGHFFGTSVDGRVSGTDALGSGRSVLMVVVVVIAGLALAVAVPSIRRQAEDLLRIAGFAAPVAVVLLAFQHSGTTAPVRVHFGFLVAFAVALFITSAAFHGANVRARHKPAPRAIRVSR